jgi:hypothetical protein
MKQLLIITWTFLVAMISQAQQTKTTSTIIEAKSTLIVGGSSITGISNDATGVSKSSTKAITEQAAKEYADQLGSPVDWFSVSKANVFAGTGTIDVSDIVRAAAAAGNKVIFLGAGTYRFGTTVDLPDSTVIIGDARRTVLTVTDNIPVFRLRNSTGGRNCQFRDLTFSGTKSLGATTSQQAIYMDTVDRVYISNVSCYNMGGYAIEVRGNALPVATYVINATKGNIINNVFVSGSYGGVSFSHRGEYNVLANSSFFQNTYGVQNSGGNNRIVGINASNNEYGFSGIGGSNHGHGVVVGSTFNHNSVYNAIVDGLTNSFIFSGCTFMAGGAMGKVYVRNSNNIAFEGCMFLANDSIIIENSTNVKFTDPTYWQGNPKWLITGDAPSILQNKGGGVEFNDVKNGVNFAITHSNGSANFTGAKIGIDQATPLFRLHLGGSFGMNKDSLPIGSGYIWAMVMDTTTGKFYRQLTPQGSGEANKLAYWSNANTLSSMTGARLTNSAAPVLTLTGSSSGTDPKLVIQNTGTGNGAGAGFEMWNDQGKSIGVYVGASTNTSVPNVASLYTGNLSGWSMVSVAGKIRFGRALNWNNSVTMSLENDGRVFIGTTSAIGSGLLQVNGVIEGADSIKGSLIVARNVIWKTITAGDGDLTAVPGAAYILPDITANRNFTIPAYVEGALIEIYVENATGFTWQTAGATLYDPAGVAITSLVGSQVYSIRAAGGKWRLLSML